MISRKKERFFHTERKMKYTHCFFDLDGTVTDSAQGITDSVRYALGKMGCAPDADDDLNRYIGPPLSRAFMEYAGMNEADALKTVNYYREYYRGTGIFSATVYDGIPDLLRELNRRGVVCVLATCKPHVFANRILEHFGLSQYFSFVSGPEFDGTRGEKHEVIAYALEQTGADPARVLMIGDRGSDVTGAKVNGIDGCGALWGFGSEAELRTAGAVAVAASPRDVLPLFDA